MKRLLVGLCLLATVTCAREGRPPESALPPAPRARLTLTVPLESQQKWGIVCEQVRRVSGALSVVLPGVLQLDQTRTARISPLVDGKVLSIRTDLGSQVRKGQPLLVIHSPQFAQVQSAFLQAHARLALARTESQRAKELLAAEAIQRREYLRREAEFEAATMELGLQESALHSLGLDHSQMEALVAEAGARTGDLSDLAPSQLSVLSPIDGRIISRDVVLGEHVHPDKTVFTVSDLSTLWAVLDAREKDLPVINRSSRVAIRSQAYPGRLFEARGIRVADVVDEHLRTIKIRVEVANPDFVLKTNMFVEGVVESDQATAGQLVVPEGAIQRFEGETAVFVREGPDRFVLRPVVIGEPSGTNRAITEGLEGTETVVVAGAFALKSELMKSTLGGE